MKNLMTKTLKTLAVAGITMGLALGAQAEEYQAAVFMPGSAVTNYYTTVSDAIDKATWNQTIMLLANSNVDHPDLAGWVFSADKTNTLDLAGWRLSVEGVGAAVIWNYGVLTVVDSSPEKTGQIYGGGHGIHQDGTLNMYGGSITNNDAAVVLSNNPATDVTFTVGGDARFYTGNDNCGISVNKSHIAIARGEHEPTDRMMVNLMMPAGTGVFVRAGAMLSDLAYFKSDKAQYYVKYIPGDSADNGQLALDYRSVTVGEFTEINQTNYTFTATVSGGVDTVWFEPKNAQIKTSMISTDHVDWSWSFANKVTGTATNAFDLADVEKFFDAIQLEITASSEADCQAALTDALSYVVIGNITNAKATLNVRTSNGGAACVGSSDVPIPEFRKNVVDTLEDVVDRYDGKYSLREVATDYAYAWDNASNIVIGVNASDNPFELSSDLILSSNLTVSANTTGLAGLGIKEQPGNIVIADGVSVTMNCALNAYAAKGSAITNCVVLGTNGCVRMDQKFMNTLGCYVKSTDDLFEKGEIKIFEPAGTKKTLEEICKNTHAYDPDGKGYTTVVNDGAIYLKAPPRINFEVSAPEGATAAVYKNAVDPANKVEAGDTIFSNSTAFVVYTVTAADKFFENGRTVVTNRLNTKVVTATDAAAPTKIGTPKLLLGVVAQRYPWDGKVDVQYKAQYVPAGTPITVTVTLPNGKTASETYDCLNGQNTVVFDARAAFGEVQVKGVKVKLSLAE